MGQKHGAWSPVQLLAVETKVKAPWQGHFLGLHRCCGKDSTGSCGWEQRAMCSSQDSSGSLQEGDIRAEI